MKKRRNRGKVIADPAFVSSGSDGSADGRSQMSLAIGSDEYQEYTADRERAKFTNKNIKQTDENDKQKSIEAIYRNTQSIQRDVRTKRAKRSIQRRNAGVDKAAELTNSYKTIRRRRKNNKIKFTQKLIEDGLDKPISKKDFDDELYDDGISAEKFVKEATRDHKAELEAKINERVADIKFKDSDEKAITPEMRRLRKAMK